MPDLARRVVRTILRELLFLDVYLRLYIVVRAGKEQGNIDGYCGWTCAHSPQVPIQCNASGMASDSATPRHVEGMLISGDCSIETGC